jgi:NAD(P)H-hydrate epimerase
MPADPAAPEVVTALPALSPRPADGHKGTFGHVLVVAGSRGMSGAAVLCGSGALRGGAGLVTVGTPEPAQPVVAAGNPCYLTLPLPADDHGQLAPAAETALLAAAAQCDVLACGPGLGQGAGTARAVNALLTGVPKPAVLDADGLNVIAHGQTDVLRRPAPLVITPHPGEFARLIGSTAALVLKDREALAVRFAAAHGLVLVLKGHVTLVTDGRRLYRNTTGNPGMATGGSGDVLTGLAAALLGQGLPAFGAAQLAVYLHGLAGDLARDELGEVSLIATDLLTHLPHAFRAVAPR